MPGYGSAVDLQEIAPRLWHWTAPHPDWTPNANKGGRGWGQDVSSYALVADDAFVIFDPLVPVDEPDGFWSALDGDVEHHGPPAIVITLYWHARSAKEIAGRYDGATVWAPAPAARHVARRVGYTHTYPGDDALPAGIRAHDTGLRGEMVLYLPSHKALLFGDMVLDGVRLLPKSWLPKRATLESVRASLRPLLDEDFELLLLTHGGPVAEDARAKLEAALDG